MRRIFLILVVAAVMAVATMALPGTAFAKSCFDDLAKLPGPGPGEEVSEVATTLAHTQTTPVGARLVPVLQEAKEEPCDPIEIP
jgi:hypothetical protein